VPAPAGYQSATKVGQPLPFRSGGSLEFGRLVSRRVELALLFFGEPNMRRPLLPEGGTGFGDLILELEQLPPLVFEPVGDLLLLPGQFLGALAQAQFLFGELCLLGDDRRRLDTQCLKMRPERLRAAVRRGGGRVHFPVIGYACPAG
jgi:hypothetical protein